MECPYCKDTIPDAAWVCKTCRRDLQLVSTLKDQLAKSQSDLEAAKAAPAPAHQPAIRRVHEAQPDIPRRTEALAVLAATAMFPAVAYHLRVIFALPPKLGTAAIVLSAGVAGMVIGLRHAHRVWVWFATAVLLAVLQVAAYSLAFGSSAHSYYKGMDSGVAAGARTANRDANRPSEPAKHLNTVGSESPVILVRHTLRDRFLWLFQAIPSACWFLILAFFGRRYAERKSGAHKGLGASLARRVTFQRPQEAQASFQQRLDGYTKIFDSLTHVVIVVLSIATSYYAIAKTTSAPPDAASVAQDVAQK